VPVYFVCFKESDKLTLSFFRMTEDGWTTSSETSDLTKYCPTNLYTKLKTRKAYFLSILNWQNYYSTQFTAIFSLRKLLGCVYSTLKGRALCHCYSRYDTIRAIMMNISCTKRLPQLFFSSFIGVRFSRTEVSPGWRG
jgi:hypothetical protein